jgi:dTDP-4-amino-4,6-dideoxygalactose transaminase
MIPVTKPFLPPIEEYENFIQQIWERNWLTNNGPLVNELELKLKQYLDLPHFLYVTNGTIALQMAIKALDLKGEIITTPFSYVATTSSLVWEGCEPVFCDIDPRSLNINPAEIESHISSKTTAIVATHTFGNACDIIGIERIAKKHRLKVIYDAAHCFGTKYWGRSIYSFGDISTASFHATKLYHTIEGGAVVTDNTDYLRRLVYMRNFGHSGPERFADLGINGKNSEMHAAMGLVNLKYIDNIIARRKALSEHYDERLGETSLTKISINPDCGYNYAYYPVLFASETALLRAVELLESHMIFPRRYFYPSLSQLPYVKRSLVPVCEDACRRILCLPLYHDLSFQQVDFICDLILRVLKPQKILSLASL